MSTGRLGNKLFVIVRKYDRRFWILVLIQLIVAVGFGAAMPFVSLYLRTQLGASMTFVGSIMLVSVLASSGGRIAGGEIADRYLFALVCLGCGIYLPPDSHGRCHDASWVDGHGVRCCVS